jgi:hypothetical protein
LRLIGQQSNRDGIGARISVFAGGAEQVREMIAGSSFLGGQDPRVHFGLGSQNVVDSLQVKWPSGSTQRLYGVEANRFMTITEGAEDGRL